MAPVTRRNPPAGFVVTTPRGRPVPNAITASAARAKSLPKPTGSVRIPQWQLDSFAYYDQIGAVRYAAQFTARALSKIRWFVGKRDENGEVKEVEDEAVTTVWDRVQDPGGGRTELLATYAQLDFLVGESYLVWAPAEDEDEEEVWEIISMLELRKQGRRGGRDIYQRIKAPGLTPQELAEADDEEFTPLGENVRVWRLWRRHPAYSMMADAPMRSVLAECEEIVRATHSINARLISRLAGPGIFAIPQSWSLKPLQQVVGDENPEEDPFQARLTSAMITAIGKPGSAESVAPIVIRVPDETTDRGHLYKIWDPNEVIRELELREKALHRFAVGVDMPPSKVEGIEGSTHWNAWMIDEDAWSHIDPTAQQLADSFASAYLRPALRQEGVSDWQEYVIGYDPASILTNPDGFKDALELYNARAVGKKYLRNSGNATEEDAPTDEELEEMIFVQTKVEVEVEGGVLVHPEPEPVPAPLLPGADGQPPTAGNGRPPTGEDTPREAPVLPEGMAASALYKILGAAEVSMEEIRGRVGTQVRNYLKDRCTECAEQAKGIRGSMVAAVLGPNTIEEHGPMDLVALAIGGGDHFVEVVRRTGVSQTQAAALGEVLELHAVSTLYEEAPELPAGFVGRVRALEGTAV